MYWKMILFNFLLKIYPTSKTHSDWICLCKLNLFLKSTFRYLLDHDINVMRD
jgi:hypothetical protein